MQKRMMALIILFFVFRLCAGLLQAMAFRIRRTCSGGMPLYTAMSLSLIQPLFRFFSFHTRPRFYT